MSVTFEKLAMKYEMMLLELPNIADGTNHPYDDWSLGKAMTVSNRT